MIVHTAAVLSASWRPDCAIRNILITVDHLPQLYLIYDLHLPGTQFPAVTFSFSFSSQLRTAPVALLGHSVALERISAGWKSVGFTSLFAGPRPLKHFLFLLVFLCWRQSSPAVDGRPPVYLHQCTKLTSLIILKYSGIETSRLHKR